LDHEEPALPAVRAVTDWLQGALLNSVAWLYTLCVRITTELVRRASPAARATSGLSAFLCVTSFLRHGSYASTGSIAQQTMPLRGSQVARKGIGRGTVD